MEAGVCVQCMYECTFVGGAIYQLLEQMEFILLMSSI